jgi:hypothetical protein
MKSMPLALSSEDEGLARTFQTEILDQADMGNGYRELISKSVIDYLTTDNGFFWELEGPGDPNGPREGNILSGIHHLDSAQCYRTFDPEYPVLYVNPITNTQHRLHHSRVLSKANLPQPNETARGVGLSPVARALQQIQLARAILQYRYEKVTGNFKKGIIFGKGTTKKAISRAVDRLNAQDELEDVVTYNGIPILLSMSGVELDLLDLASLPDHFDLETELTLYVYILSLAFGVDAREFWPATSSGATKADASVQHMKARGKGLADLITTFEDALNSVAWVGVTATYDYIDDEHDAEIVKRNQALASLYGSLEKNGFIDKREGRAHLISKGVLDPDIINGLEDIEGMDRFNDIEAGIQAQADQEFERQQALKPPKPEPVPQPGSRSANTYRTALRAVIRGVWQGEMGYLQALDAFTSAVRRHFTQAAISGAKENGVTFPEFSEKELNYLNSRIFDELQYVPGFINTVMLNPKGVAPIDSYFNRIDQWVSRWGEVRKRLQIMTAGNKKFLWKMDPGKEHCIDCLRLHGKVFRASVWESVNAYPNSPSLSCGLGGKCGCLLEETSAPLSKGRPPKLVGPGKHISIPTRLVQKFLEVFNGD